MTDQEIETMLALYGLEPIKYKYNFSTDKQDIHFKLGTVINGKVTSMVYPAPEGGYYKVQPARVDYIGRPALGEVRELILKWLANL